jgi:hypothetical protein
MKSDGKTKLAFPRSVLLVEIDRRCSFADCGAKNLIGLTRDEAIEYRGFDCLRCQRWTDDRVGARELPDSWSSTDEELRPN